MDEGDFLVANVRMPDGDLVDVVVSDGRIDRVVDGGAADPTAVDSTHRYDGEGRLVTPPLVEPHVHLDAALTAGEPRWNREGTLAAGIDIWDERRARLDEADVRERATRVIEWFAANGVTRIRTHVDVSAPTLTGLEAMLSVRESVEDLVDLQIVAFPQDGVFTDPENADRFREAVDRGADVVGGAPHLEDTREEGVQSVELAVDLAVERGAPIDLHIDETDDPDSRFTETLARTALESGHGELTTASHATAMHSYPDDYASTVVELLAESGVSVVTNPLDNSVLQGRQEDYPRRRGHTRIDELHAAGVTVGIGHDSVMDPWYHYGRADPLDAAYVLVHYAHMNGRDDVETIWRMLTDSNQSILRADEYGLEAGKLGSLVVYDGSTPFEVLRTRAARRLVLRKGRPIARTSPADTTITRPDGTRSIDFHR